MPVPEITHLQSLVLAILVDGEMSGKAIREKMAEAGEPKGGPAFYQFMSRLEEASLVKGWYDQKIIDGQIIKERRYKITSSGSKALREAHEFYIKLKHGLQAL
jgi:DNA-binding PadR family transcriptional regulator